MFKKRIQKKVVGFITCLFVLLPVSLEAAEDEYCPNPPGWSPENLPDLIRERQTSDPKQKLNLCYADLSNMDFRGLDLSHADLSHSRIINSIFTGAILMNVNFTGTYIENSDFTNVDLSQANFKGAEIRGVIFTDALLYLTNLKMITIGSESRDKIAEFCRVLTRARAWQYSYRDEKLLCGAKALPGTYPLK